MRLVIAHVPDCPSAAVLEQRLRLAVAGRSAPLDYALLVDGIDPFAEPDLAPSAFCRLCRDEHGHIRGAPSVAALRHALDLEHRDR